MVVKELTIEDLQYAIDYVNQLSLQEYLKTFTLNKF